MGDTANVQKSNRQPDADSQPLALKDFLISLSSIRRLSSLYGLDHPSTEQGVSEFANVLKALLECFGPSTLVLTEDAVVLNDHWYEASQNSQELFNRLRSRGAMAFSLVSEPSSDELAEFLLYLNTEPREVRNQGGSNAYLRKHGVTRIVATDALFAAGDDSESTEVGPTDSRPMMDRALASVITWLTRQDEDIDTPRLHISEIFADPDAAAKLIREAVTKLHASAKQKKTTELATDAVNDLKDMAAGDTSDWDKAAPQIRKAISKLPREMRPVIGVFGSCDQDVEMGIQSTAHVSDVEAVVDDFLITLPLSGEINLESSLPELDKLFGAQSNGLLSNWQRELLPENFARSSIETLSSLMAMETNSSDHAQIVLSLAALTAKAIDANDSQTVLQAAAGLLREILATDQPPWRNVNARSALQSLDAEKLSSMIQTVLQTGSQEDQDAAAQLVACVPALAQAISGSLSSNWNRHFIENLKAGLVQAGRAAGAVLGKQLANGDAAVSRLALEILADLQTDWSLLEIEKALLEADDAFTITALSLVGKNRSPISIRIIVDHLRHKSAEVRRTAIHLLGEIGCESDAANLIQFVSPQAVRQSKRDEQIDAIEVLARIGGPDVVPCLEAAASRRPFFWRSRYEPVRIAAVRAINVIETRLAGGKKAA